MKKGLLGGIGLAVVIIAGLICVAKCSVRVPAGYIAVEYKMNGGISKLLRLKQKLKQKQIEKSQNLLLPN